MRRPTFSAALAIALCTAAALVPALALVAGAASVGGRIYRNPALRVQQLELPRGWDLVPAQQLAYPRLLLSATSGTARMTFAAQRIAPGTTAAAVAEEARAGLVHQGWIDPRVTVEPERARLEARFDQGRRTLRQAYVVDGDLAFVLSLAMPTDRKDRWQREFEDTLRSLVITPIATAPTDGGT